MTIRALSGSKIAVSSRPSTSPADFPVSRLAALLNRRYLPLRSLTKIASVTPSATARSSSPVGRNCSSARRRFDSIWASSDFAIRLAPAAAERIAGPKSSQCNKRVGPFNENMMIVLSAVRSVNLPQLRMLDHQHHPQRLRPDSDFAGLTRQLVTIGL